MKIYSLDESYQLISNTPIDICKRLDEKFGYSKMFHISYAEFEHTISWMISGQAHDPLRKLYDNLSSISKHMYQFIDEDYPDEFWNIQTKEVFHFILLEMGFEKEFCDLAAKIYSSGASLESKGLLKVKYNNATKYIYSKN